MNPNRHGPAPAALPPQHDRKFIARALQGAPLGTPFAPSEKHSCTTGRVLSRIAVSRRSSLTSRSGGLDDAECPNEGGETLAWFWDKPSRQCPAAVLTPRQRRLPVIGD